MTTFGARLAEAREEKGIALSDFAKRIGVKYNTYYNWEHDIAKPMRDPIIRSMADTLGVSYNWLIAGVGEKSKAKCDELLELQNSKQTTTKVVVTESKPKKFYAKDNRQLEDIELCIKHIKDMNLTEDEKKAIFLTLSEIRTDLEVKVLFGVTA